MPTGRPATKEVIICVSSTSRQSAMPGELEATATVIHPNLHLKHQKTLVKMATPDWRGFGAH